MSATKIGSASSLDWGIASAESNMIVLDVRKRRSNSFKKVPTLQGETGGGAYYDAMTEITVDGYTTGTVPALAATFTCANFATDNLYVESTEESLTTEDFAKVSITAKAYDALVTS